MLCVLLEGGGLGSKGLGVMVLVDNLDRIEAHIVDSHEDNHPPVGLRVGEVSVLVVWFGARIFLFVLLLNSEEFKRLWSPEVGLTGAEDHPFPEVDSVNWFVMAGVEFIGVEHRKSWSLLVMLVVFLPY